MRENTPKPPGLAYRLCCFVLPLISLAAIFYFTNDLIFSFVASLVVAIMLPMTRFIYELNSDK
ncbi:hypothetical protein [Muriicola marianensis]|uniref:Uncharacterized protein n=1 Tax=Muriicola marianensis TaxID=1324801 RepID=A0ABQ1QZI6_9FLAO|nr:hypothetical protein [Muriicola marianensis]GGD50624.1 hypothetical protein GCM10011361_16610 [Muriicola marianensis]